MNIQLSPEALERIDQIVADAPPLSADVRAKLAVLLSPDNNMIAERRSA